MSHANDSPSAAYHAVLIHTCTHPQMHQIIDFGKQSAMMYALLGYCTFHHLIFCEIVCSQK